MSEKSKLAVTICILLVIALLSYFVVGNVFTDPANFSKSIEYLEDKQGEIFSLTGTTLVVSVALGLIPGDATTPLADKVTDIGSYFLIALCAIFLEKYLLTLTGLAAFKFLIPAACVVFAFGAFLRNHSLKQFAIKLVLLGLIITAVVPTSIRVSQVIEKTSQVSIEDIENKKNQIISESFPDIPAEEITTEVENETKEGFSISGVIEYFSKLSEKASETVKSIGSGITENVQKAINNVQDYLHILMIMLATMIVTTCLVPLGVFWLFTWVSKALLSINIDLNVMSIRNRVQNIEHSTKIDDVTKLPASRD